MQLIIRLLVMLKNGESSIEDISKAMRGRNRYLVDAIKKLRAKDEVVIKRRFGETVLNLLKGSVLEDSNSEIPFTDTDNSSWIGGIAWTPMGNTLTLKVKTGKAKTYKLPFCPRKVAVAIISNQSPGKALWNGYWRKFGKGKVSNKFKNKMRVSGANLLKSSINRKIPKKFGISNATIKTANIPRTGAKGIKITYKRPSLKRRK